MNFLSTITDTLFGQIIATFFVSMVPIIELRGAIPMAVAWGLDYWIAIPVAIVGNLVPVPFIIIFIRRIFEWMKVKLPKLGNLVDRLEKRAHLKGQMVQKWSFWGLLILVAIPLPGTGAWTGALVAAILDMRLKKALPAIALGVVIAGAIVTFVTYGISGIIA